MFKGYSWLAAAGLMVIILKLCTIEAADEREHVHIKVHMSSSGGHKHSPRYKATYISKHRHQSPRQAHKTRLQRRPQALSPAAPPPPAPPPTSLGLIPNLYGEQIDGQSPGNHLSPPIYLSDPDLSTNNLGPVLFNNDMSALPKNVKQQLQQILGYQPISGYHLQHQQQQVPLSSGLMQQLFTPEIMEALAESQAHLGGNSYGNEDMSVDSNSIVHIGGKSKSAGSNNNMIMTSDILSKYFPKFPEHSGGSNHHNKDKFFKKSPKHYSAEYFSQSNSYSNDHDDDDDDDDGFRPITQQYYKPYSSGENTASSYEEFEEADSDSDSENDADDNFDANVDPNQYNTIYGPFSYQQQYAAQVGATAAALHQMSPATPIGHGNDSNQSKSTKAKRSKTRQRLNQLPSLQTAATMATHSEQKWPTAFASPSASPSTGTNDFSTISEFQDAFRILPMASPTSSTSYNNFGTKPQFSSSYKSKEFLKQQQQQHQQQLQQKKQQQQKQQFQHRKKKRKTTLKQKRQPIVVL